MTRPELALRQDEKDESLSALSMSLTVRLIAIVMLAVATGLSIGILCTL